MSKRQDIENAIEFTNLLHPAHDLTIEDDLRDLVKITSDECDRTLATHPTDSHEWLMIASVHRGLFAMLMKSINTRQRAEFMARA